MSSRRSQLWYRVAGLRPRLARHARFHRHLYRGRRWYVLEDPGSGRCHRLAPRAWRIAGLMDGRLTTQEIWSLVQRQMGDEAPTQDETIRLLGLLHAADLLRADVSPDVAEVLRRSQRTQPGEGWRRLVNPLSIKIPLLDPDPLLSRWVHVVRPIFSRLGALCWAAIVALGGALALAHAPALAADASLELLDPRNLVLMWLLFPLVKGLHELAHGFATKAWGGEVHEMGILLMVFVPVPYVDASSASAFPSKWRRMTVALAGIAVELALACVALGVWLAAEPGLLRTAAYDVMLISGVSTLLFNGNPLLRFDGYYALCDVLEIPNLAARSRSYLAWLALHHGFGLEQVRYPVEGPGERPWLLVYGIASFVYRIAITLSIALLVAGRFFVVGALLAAATVVLQIVVPIARQVAFLLTSPRLGAKRPRALAVSGAVLGTLAVLLLVVPLPSFTNAEGVVWPPAGSEVHSGSDGFVREILVGPGTRVAAGTALVRVHDPELEAERAVLEARVRELRARRHADAPHDRVRARISEEALATARAQLARARERAVESLARSPVAGRFVVPDPDGLGGRYLKQGDLIGYVVESEVRTVRVVLPQTDVAWVREHVDDVQVRLSRELSAVLPARIIREVPAATNRLPSAALGSTGGGRFAVDPADERGLRTLETVFELDLELPEHAGAAEIGGRAYVRFHHGAEPAAQRITRAVRRVFLRQLGV